MTRQQVMQGYCKSPDTVECMLSAYDDISDEAEDTVPSWLDHPVNTEVHDEGT